ncbi:MAG: TIGR04283 family arsenosugar biosynthesis glycosyltransferase [Burkholderiales bacterium]|nr:TIGR04283 family arsenosugar biosynthesis glycosyltransferase [Burkholderiales bacterium]
MANPLSIIVPVLDEAGCVAASLDALAPLRARGHELIVVDGGSRDNTLALSQARADIVLEVPRGRARQMNAGAARAHGSVLLFLHADTSLPAEADAAIARAVAGGALWGRFDVKIEGRSRWFPLIAALMNRRSRWSGVATGDQAMFVERALFERIGGFTDQPLMEDIELSRRLRRIGRPACLRERVLTSGRRWEQNGVWRTILLMWRLRWRYWRGTPPELLAKAYR